MQNLHVLIIDDDQIDREIIKRNLKSSYPNTLVTVTEAETGRAGVEKLNAEKYNCVFLDYRLPDMDGIDILKKFYDPEMDVTKNPVVMLTGQANISVMLDALHFGAQDYLLKDNVTRESLMVAVTKAQELHNLKITQKESQLRLLQSQKMEALGQLTSGVAHDFNNLLTVVLGNARLLQKRLQDGSGDLTMDDIVRKIQTIEGAAKRGADLVKRLMVFSRQGGLSKDMMDINVFISDVSDILKQTMGERIKITTHFCAKPWPLQLDANQFTTLLINMAVNAKHAMPDGGQFSIETSNIVWDEFYGLAQSEKSCEHYVLITLSDTGIGMSDQVMQRIFEPFYTTKPVGQGTGLGLSMAYGFLQQAGGHIHLYSEEKHGTVFRLYIPVQKEFQIEEIDEDFPLSHGDETILIVSHCDKSRRSDRTMFEKLGYQAADVQSGRIAIEVLQRDIEKFSLIAIEASLSGEISCQALTKTIQNLDASKPVFISVRIFKKNLPEYQTGLIDKIICRPYRLSELAFAIRTQLDSNSNVIEMDRYAVV